MRFKFLLTNLFFFIFLYGFFAPKTVFAETYTLSGNVSDSLGVHIIGAVVDIIDASNNTNIVSTTTNSEGNYTTIINAGTYNVQLTPPVGSSFSPAIALGQIINKNSLLDFILVPTSDTITLSGRVLDALGNGVPNQCVGIGTDSGNVSTDSSGYYSIQAVPGNYFINILPCSSSNNISAIPQYYGIT